MMTHRAKTRPRRWPTVRGVSGGQLRAMMRKVRRWVRAIPIWRDTKKTSAQKKRRYRALAASQSRGSARNVRRARGVNPRPIGRSHEKGEILAMT